MEVSKENISECKLCIETKGEEERHGEWKKCPKENKDT